MIHWFSDCIKQPLGWFKHEWLKLSLIFYELMNTSTGGRKYKPKIDLGNIRDEIAYCDR